MARSRRSRQRGRGAVAAIKSNVAKSKVKHPGKPSSKTLRSGASAQQRLGGHAGGSFDNVK